jgi:hypothetical protein
MPITNEDPPGDGLWGGLFRLQSEFQARLTEETLRYLRSVQATFSPRAPGTVVQASGVRLRSEAWPGGQVDLEVTVENRQRVHTSVAPALTPLVSDDGWTWYPKASVEPPAMLLAPDEARTICVAVQLPAELPVGVFRGSLVLHGFAREGVPVEITVAQPAPVPAEAAEAVEPPEPAQEQP